MKPAIRTLALALAALVFAGAGTAEASRRRKPSRKSPHAEITAVARVETAPQRKVHSNRRSFEEFDVMILSSRTDADQGRGADGRIVVARDRSVHIVHDLTCGGTWVALAPGDQVELKGEYVQPPNGADLIHFTHPAGGECGRGEPHPDGYLRKVDSRQSAVDSWGPGHAPTGSRGSGLSPRGGSGDRRVPRSEMPGGSGSVLL
jgi:hypothetical protein